jgi:CMP-N-acetylneuraminic acid synthetase
MLASIIFGREGSKSIKNKNLLNVNGKKIMEYPLMAIKKSKIADEMYVSTDSDRIFEVAKKYGCKLIARPENLCSDSSLLLDAILHAKNEILKSNKQIEFLAINLCNAPNITTETVIKAYDKLKNNSELDSVISVSRYEMFSPERARKLNVKGELVPYIPFEHFSNHVSCDRKSHDNTYFSDQGLTIVRVSALENWQENLLPFQWMGKKIGYVEQESGGGDVDLPWQIGAIEYWLKNNPI